MKKILYILLALLFVGCELDFMPNPEQEPPINNGGDNGDGGNDEGEGGVPADPLPSQPIKRRPITPRDKILRPRLIVKFKTTIEIMFDDAVRSACHSVTLRSDSTGEEYTLFIDDTSAITLPLMENSSDYTLTIECDGEDYVEQITIL